MCNLRKRKHGDWADMLLTDLSSWDIVISHCLGQVQPNPDPCNTYPGK